jgi:hypothetical protein
MSTIAAGTTSGTALVSTGNTAGTLVFQTNGTTTALTLGTDQSATFVGAVTAPSFSGTSSTATNLAGGSNGTIPYQSAAGTTQMLAVGTAGQLLQTNGAGAPSWATVSAGYTLGTAVAVSGSALIEFASLPAGIKNIIISFYRVSLGSGVADISLQLGKAAGYATSATQSQSIRLRDPNIGAFSFETSTFEYVPVGSGTSTAFYNGSIILTLVDSTNNFWAAQGTLGSTDSTAIFLSTASINLAGTLTKLKILSGGNFDSGTLNIAYI